MTPHALVTFGLYLSVLLLLAWPLGLYVARVLSGESHPLARLLGGLERGLYRLAGVKEDDEQPWTRYALSFLVFNAAGLFAVYLLQRLQGLLPLNPAGLAAVSPHLAFNTAVSFATNTNWQSYGGETTMSHLTQMLGLTVQNFVSAAAGIAVFAAIARGFARRKTGTVGSFWVDLTRSTLYVLLPLSFVLALALVSQGVVQTFSGKAEVPYLNPPSAETPI